MLDFPEIVAPAEQPDPRTEVAQAVKAAIDLKSIDLTDVALAQFGDWRGNVAAVAKTLTGVVHDLSTPTKILEAKSLRHRLIGQPLAEARKVSTGLKSKLASVSKDIGAELARIEADYGMADKLITPQIEAAEAKAAEEKRIAAEKEAARKQAHIDQIAVLAGYADKAVGLPSERIARGIAMVEGIELRAPAWEEFYDRAVDQKEVTLERMRKYHAEALAAEQLEAQRIENERIAAEQRTEQERLAAERAEFERQRAEFEAAQRAAAIPVTTEIEAPPAGPVADGSQEPNDGAAIPAAKAGSDTTAQDSQQVLKAEAPEPDATDRDAPASTSPSVGSMGAGQASDEAPAKPVIAIELKPATAFEPPAPEPRPTLTLGEIKERLGFVVTADFLAALGFAAVQEKQARLFHESDFNAICAAIGSHVLSVGAKFKKKATA